MNNHSDFTRLPAELYAEYQDRLLGILICEIIKPGDIVLQLREEYFDEGIRKNTFKAIRSLRAEDKPINTLTVRSRMIEMNVPTDVVFLASLDSGLYSHDGWKVYRYELHCRYIHDQIEKTKIDFLKHQDVDRLYKEIQDIKSLDPDPIATEVHELLLGFMMGLNEVITGATDNSMTRTFHHNTDSLITGFKPSEFIILGGRPAMGKTTLALQYALNQAMNKKPVAFFTLEMSTEQLMTRLVSNLAEVDGEVFLDIKERMSGQDFLAISQHIDKVKGAPLHVVDVPGIDPQRMELELIKLIKKHKIEGAYIDYLQLISPLPEDRGKPRIEQVTNISKYIKTICKRLNIWICVVSSLSRGVEQRDSKRPKPSDLRETGQLEFDADKILFVYRPSEYMEDHDPQKQELIDLLEILVRKNRNGKIGTAMGKIKLQYTKVLDFNGNIPTFEEKIQTLKAPF